MIKDQLNIEKNLISKVLANDEKYLKALYREWREEFISWAKRKYQLNAEECSEIYQDTFLQLFISIREKKVEEITHPKTYFYGIGKNLMRQKFKHEGKSYTGLDELDLSEDNEFIVRREQTEQRQEIAKVLDHFGEPCRSLLMMFYFDRYSHEVIAERMGYKNEQVVKKKKSLCMSELRKLWIDYRKKTEI